MIGMAAIASAGAPPAARATLLVILAFLVGSLPFGLMIGRLVRGIDVRQHGSGNLGATNVLRTLGRGWGVAVAWLPGWLGLGSVASGSPWPAVAAVAAVAGHVLTPFAGFRGGKGVATLLGAFLALAPLPALIGVLGFGITVAVSGFVSLGSLTLALLMPLATILWGPPAPLRGYAVVAGVLLAILIAVRHRANVSRIAAGTESRIRGRKK
jgi:glycerol-3-phosphate acyltransferase PlsY